METVSTRSDDNGKDTIVFVRASSPSPPPAEDQPADARPEGAVSATGDINWDCPCLGGLAYGPCGDQFRAAFSCFVYSEAEPKGIDCVEKFQTMQECFRQHPDIYADELRDDDDDEGIPMPPPGGPSGGDIVADPTAEAVEPSGTEPSGDLAAAEPEEVATPLAAT